MTNANNKDEEIERLARIMCRAEGISPDATAACIPLATTHHGITFVPEGSLGAAWQGYARLASGIVDSYPKIELVSADRPVPYANWIRDVKSYAHDLLDPSAKPDDIIIAIGGLRSCFKERVE